MDEELIYMSEAVPHPGEEIKVWIEEKGITTGEFADSISRPVEDIEAILRKDKPINEDLAHKIEEVYKIPADYWMRYQSSHNEYFKKEKAWSKNFPVKELIRRGYIKDTDNEREMIENLHKFFGTYDCEDWGQEILEKKEPLFRISPTVAKHKYAILTWLRMGEIEVEKQKNVNSYTPDKFKKSLEEAKRLVVEHPEDLLKQLQTICAKAGVCLAYIPPLKGAPVNGAMTWLEERPCILLSDRYKTNDIFWFSFFHEAGHILLHGKQKHGFVEVEGGSNDKRKEEEANKFAKDYTLTDDQMKQVQSCGMTKEKISEFAEKFYTHPGIIVGGYQRHNNNCYNTKWMNDLKEEIKFTSSEKE